MPAKIIKNIITLTEIILHWIIVFSFALGLRGEAMGPTFNNALEESGLFGLWSWRGFFI